MCAPTTRQQQQQLQQKKVLLAAAATEEHGFSTTLVKAHPDHQQSSTYLAWALVTLATSSFYLGPILLLLPFLLYNFYPQIAVSLFCLNIILVLQPIQPWLQFRKYCQLFYTVFNFHHNMTSKLNDICKEEKRLSIVAMHPHAIIPLHGFIWSAICDQLLPDMYGVGATTDGAMILPILRHLLRYMNVGSTQKKKIMKSMQNDGENLFMLPGGVAEIFLSHRRQTSDNSLPHIQTIKAKRYGLMKLALQTGAVVYPAYTFGATDMLDQLTPTVTNNEKNGSKSIIGSIMEYLSRKIKGGLTLYYGKYYLPIPHNPQLSMVLGNPIYPVLDDDTTELNVCGDKRTCKRIANPTDEQVEKLMERYVNALQYLFEQYKIEAGYPNDMLHII